MKKIILIILPVLIFVSCREDYYEGDERVVIEGTVMNNDAPLQNAEVRVFPVYNATPTSNIISEVNDFNSNNYDDDGYTIIKTKTDNSGRISLSVPRNINTSVYVISISNNYNTKNYGYISKYNTKNYYVNLGTLIF